MTRYFLSFNVCGIFSLSFIEHSSKFVSTTTKQKLRSSHSLRSAKCQLEKCLVTQPWFINIYFFIYLFTITFFPFSDFLKSLPTKYYFGQEIIMYVYFLFNANTKRF